MVRKWVISLIASIFSAKCHTVSLAGSEDGPGVLEDRRGDVEEFYPRGLDYQQQSLLEVSDHEFKLR